MQLAIINDYQRLAFEAADWRRLPPHIAVDFYDERVTDGEAAAALLEPYDIVVTSREETRFDRPLLDRLPNLKLLITHGMNNAALDLSALAAKRVTVCGTGYGFTEATAELTWGLILSLVKHIADEDRTIRSGGWGAALAGGLTGKTLALLGLGDLGGKVARVGSAFAMDVIAWSQNLTPGRCDAVGARLTTKEELFAHADILSVHLKLGARTRGLVGRRELGSMKPTAILINTARGPIVDEAALVEALERGTIAGAGLDVFDVEPLPPDHKLRILPNTVLTSHIGGRTRENIQARYRDCLEDVLAWLDGRALRVLVGPYPSP